MNSKERRIKSWEQILKKHNDGLSFLDFYLPKVLNKSHTGLEIGGPSHRIFKRVYDIGMTIDGLNHENNIWQGNIKQSHYINGCIQHFGDALELDSHITGYDFILASHVLEHIANPLKALFHWKERIKKNGFIFLVLPRKEKCFDHRRPITPINVLIGKYHKDVDESDLSSLNEILALHDLGMDKPAGTFKQFKQRSLDNYTNRCLHHHVFDLNLLERIAKFIDMDVVCKDTKGNGHYIIFKN